MATATSSDDAPILVLGCHRSGTSAVTGLLSVASGLRVGDVLPATDANPAGYFESAAVVRSHNQVLDRLDRDWTCPPAGFDPAAVRPNGLAEVVADLAAGDGPWAVKDPRTLFMLPLWAEVLDRVRFVGVVRDHEEVVRSLVARDGLDPAVADTIVRAHVRRLLDLRRAVAFPIVDFSADPADLLATTAEVAGGLGLDFDHDAGRAFLDPDLATTRGRGQVHDPNLDALRELAGRDDAAAVVDGAGLAELVGGLAGAVPSGAVGDPGQLDRHSGPRTAVRRRRTWRAVPTSLHDHAVEFTRNLRQASSIDPVPDGAVAVECRSLETVWAELLVADPRPDVVVLSDVTSWPQVDQLEPLLRMLHELLDDGTMVVLARSTADDDTRAALGRPRLSADALVAMAGDAGFSVVTADTADGDGHLQVGRLMVRPTAAKQVRKLLRGGDAGRVATRNEPLDPGDEGDWERRYRRLRTRRSVRTVLTATKVASPVYRRVRGLGRRLRRD